MEWLWWVGAALIFAVIEVLSLALVLVMFAGGALAAAVAALLGAPLWGQISVFVLVSAALLVALRPWLLRHLKRRVPLVETNAAAQVGRTAIVVAPVDDHGGRIKLSGEVWTARTEDGAPRLLAGVEVEVIQIDGATAVVRALAADRPTTP